MLFLVRFQNDDQFPVLIDAATVEAAAERVAQEVEGVDVATLTEVPAGLLCCEVKFAESEENANAADLTDSGVALDPFADFAAWLELADGATVPLPEESEEPSEAPDVGV